MKAILIILFFTPLMGGLTLAELLAIRRSLRGETHNKHKIYIQMTKQLTIKQIVPLIFLTYLMGYLLLFILFCFLESTLSLILFLSIIIIFLEIIVWKRFKLQSLNT